MSAEAVPVTDATYWDGLTHAYIPPADAQPPASLTLQSEEDDSVDPVTYEVVRHNLWNINREHAAIVENLAVSTIVLETRDLQSAILTADGEMVAFGTGVGDMAGWFDLVVKYLVCRKGDTLADGDIWLVNDPWIGAAHQPDVTFACPVFYEGRLFCWMVNAAHQNDVGGTMPGSFCPNAEDIYFDPPLFPPCRIVKDHVIDAELEAIYRRQSRTPTNLALDLRASVAGAHAARTRLIGLLDRYGAPTVKAVMTRMLGASERAFGDLLETIPDGEWSERVYNEVAVTGERGLHRWELQLRKAGGRLTFSNSGTGPQAGAINLTYGGWRGCILAALNVLTAAEQMGCLGGAIRLTEFAPVSGTLSCADFGAAVSPAGLYTLEVATAMANSVLSKMLMTSRESSVRARALTPTMAQWHIHIHAGVNARGDYYVGPMLDMMIGASGATETADGAFANGLFLIPEGRGPNVETYERAWPMLYLYRREDPDSGGAGRRRGGNGGRLAYIRHGGEMVVGVYSAEGVPKSPGLLGGAPGNTGETNLVRESNVLAEFRAGRVPTSLEAVTGRPEQVYGKGPALTIGADDVLEWNWGGTAGYGDPITREPHSVFADVRSGVTSRESAREHYGVVLAADGVDEGATAAVRDKIRRERLRSCGVDHEPRSGAVPIPPDDMVIGDDIWVDRTQGAFRCARCGEITGLLTEHSKSRLVWCQQPIAEIGSRFCDPSTYVDDPVVWRTFFCPGCATRLATEVARPDDAPLPECKLDING